MLYPTLPDVEELLQDEACFFKGVRGDSPTSGTYALLTARTSRQLGEDKECFALHSWCSTAVDERSAARHNFHFHDMFYFHATCDKKCVNVTRAPLPRLRDYETVIVSQGVAVEKQNALLLKREEKKRKVTELHNQDYTVNLWKDESSTSDAVLYEMEKKKCL